MNQKLKPIFLALLLGCFMFTFTACTVEKNITAEENTESSSSKEELKSTGEKSGESKVNKEEVHPSIKGLEDELSFAYGILIPDEDYTVPYIDYDEIFLKEGEEDITTGRYSDITPDGKIDWSIESQTFREGDIQENLMSKLTINGEKISLPRQFKDLGEEYAVFDKVDFSKIEKENDYPYAIMDKKTGNKLASTNFIDESNFQLVLLHDKENKLITTFNVELENNKILGLYSNLCYISLLDLRIDGIGVGSTLNEMYEKIGLPSFVEEKMCAYYCENDDYRYLITFTCYNFSEKKIKNNIITDVRVLILEEKDEQ